MTDYGRPTQPQTLDELRERQEDMDQESCPRCKEPNNCNCRCQDCWDEMPDIGQPEEEGGEK